MRTQITVVVMLAAGCAAGGCSTPHASEPRAPQPVRTALAAMAPAQPAVRYSASIEPFEQVSLAFKASGYVDTLLQRPGADGRMRVAQAGDRITRGTVLARVRDADYRERLAQGRAKIAEGDASLVKARLDLERARTLFASESLTKPELDAAQSAYDTALARMASARADVELAQSALADASLVAPAAGIILERRIEVGTLASAGTVGFLIGDLSFVKARFGIPDGMIGAIHLGDQIGVTVEGTGAATFTGRVTAIAPAADPQSRVFDVEVSIANQDGRLRPGMIGTVAVEPRAGSTPPAAAARPVIVPLTAVIRSEQSGAAFAVLVIETKDTKDVAVARVRPVELGDVMGNGITVLKGLNAGERIIVSGATLVADGEVVKVIQ
jgi:multidrug efflux system membrane fusion protein